MNYSPETLADRLGLSPDAIRKQLKRLQLVERFRKSDPLAAEVCRELVHYNAEHGRTEETRTAAAALLEGEEPGAAPPRETPPPPEAPPVVADTPTPAPPPAAPPAEENAPAPAPLPEAPPVVADTLAPAPSVTPVPPSRSERLARTLADGLLSVVTLLAMYVQIVHTAAVVSLAKPSATDLSALYVDVDWAYAIAIQFTGLAMTLYHGSRVYLIIFAVAEFLINLFYYRPWVTDSWDAWLLSVLLAALIAFTIFSYAEVFAARRRYKTTDG